MRNDSDETRLPQLRSYLSMGPPVLQLKEGLVFRFQRFYSSIWSFFDNNFEMVVLFVITRYPRNRLIIELEN